MTGPNPISWLPEQSKEGIASMDAWLNVLKRPIFSVVIGTYNHKHLLPKVMAGWEGQTFRDGFEVFVCDDHSNDGTEEWAKEYEEKSKKDNRFRFTYLRIPERIEPGCLAKNLNQAMPLATGHFVLFCMGDTVPQEDTLVQYAKHVASDRVLCGVRKNIDQNLEFQSLDWRYKDREHLLEKDIIPINDEAPWASITGNGLVVPLWALRQVGGWSEEYHGWESDDYDLALRLYEAGLNFFHTPKAIILHFEHKKQPRALGNVQLFKKSLLDYKEKIRTGITSITLDLDDFYPSNNALFYLKELKAHFPKMKVSLFTVPFKKVDDRSVESWMTCPELVEEINSYDWIEILPHGFFHVMREMEMVDYKQTVLMIRALEENFRSLRFHFARVFKAPHWQIGWDALAALRDLGYAVAINPEDKEKMRLPEGLRTYEHNWGIQFPIPRRQVIRGHGHVQNWNGTGLVENFSNLLDLSTTAEWKFVSECVPPPQNINTVDYWDATYELEEKTGNREKEKVISSMSSYILEEIEPLDKVVEFACGDGFLAEILSDKVGKIVGIDFSPKAIEIAKKRCPQAIFNVGDVRYPIPNLSCDFDVAVAGEIWEHLDDPRDLINRVLFHLRSGGKFIFSLPNANALTEKEHVYEYYPRDVKRILAEFPMIDDVRVQILPGDCFMLVIGRKK